MFREDYRLARVPFLQQYVRGVDIVNSRHRIGLPLACPHCNARVWIQERIKSSSKAKPRWSLCCSDGQVKIPELRPEPHILRLLTSNARFRQDIRKYNSVLSFTSIGVNLDQRLANQTQGVYTFRIQGAVVHKIGSLLPVGNQHKFSQIYILDSDTAQVASRQAAFQNTLNDGILTDLQEVLGRTHPLAQHFKSILERERHQQGANSRLQELRIVLKGEGRAHRPRRQYDLPSTSEIAVLLPGDTMDTGTRDIIIQGRDDHLHRIVESSPDYDLLHYVLIHALGDQGWTFRFYEKRPKPDGMDEPEPEEEENDEPHMDGGWVSACDFYAYRVQIRPISQEDSRCWLWLFGRLAHQYVVDQWAKVETQKLLWLSRNQNTIRADLYQGVADAIAADVNAVDIGRRIVLPSSFTGSPRQMHQLFQDAMAIVRTFGKPDLFITFTCNPKWPEIVENLDHGQTANDRPDLCVRFFKMKLDALLDDLIAKEFLGTVVGYTWVVEFQKRGLPHVHILLILADKDKPRTAAEIDAIVSAEVPDIGVHPLAHETVLRTMVHGPCGPEYPNAPCMKDGKCSKGFPRALQEETDMNDNGYPKYRRRRTDPIARPNGVQVDNRWIVPHNLYLCTKYDAHINVEICTSVTAVKYLFKYVYKGSDRANMAVDQEGNQDDNNRQAPDEPKEYVDARYLSPCECLWRLFKFPLHKHHPSIIRLPIHEENQQPVYFQGEADLTTVLDNARDSMLMGWFKLNQRDPNARQYTYQEIGKHYVWGKKTWRLRKRNTDAIPRLYFVHPRQGERFCLRILLLHARGATSFADLRTPQNGDAPYATFRQAAIARGLLNDEAEWKLCLSSATEFVMPFGLRDIFATILYHGSPADPLALWNQFARHLAEDFVHRFHVEHGGAEDDYLDQAKRRTLGEINKLLKEMGSSLSDFPTLPQDFDEENQAGPFMDAETAQQLATTALINRGVMNEGQGSTFDTVLSAIENSGEQQVFFVDGPGGTGKSFVYNTLIAHITGVLGKDVISVASSGIAALVLRGGQTAHSTFKIPIPALSHSTCSFGKRSDIARRLQAAVAIFWDEAPMMTRIVFETVDRSLRDLMDTPDLLFGGKVVVFGGDFRQVAPVVVRGSPAQIAQLCLNASETIWSHVHTLPLTTNMRTQDPAFAQFLLSVGDGREPSVEFGDHSDYIRIPDQFLLQAPHDNGDGMAERLLIQEIYPDLRTTLPTPDFLAERAILSTLNRDVDFINDMATEMMTGTQGCTYLAIDTIPEGEDSAGEFPTEFLNSLSITSLAPYKLTLKIGQPVILIRNMNRKQGMCNGTRLIIRHLKDRLIGAEIMHGDNKGQTKWIPRIPLTTNDEDGQFPVKFTRLQFPVRPAFAMTINKSQGQTLTRVGLYLPQPVFGHGQLYVAMSRCSDPKNLKILIKDGTIPNKQGTYTRNVVFRKILSQTNGHG